MNDFWRENGPPALKCVLALEKQHEYARIIHEHPIDPGDPLPGDWSQAWDIPSWITYITVIAAAHRKLRQHDRALILYQWAARLGDSPELRINIVLCALDLDRLHGLDLLLADVVNEHPDFTYAWFLRGQIALREGQRSAAAEYLARAAALDPDHPEILLARINLARELADWDSYDQLKEHAQTLRSQSEIHILPLIEATASPLDCDEPAEMVLLSQMRAFKLSAHLDGGLIYRDYPRIDVFDRLRIGYVSANFGQHPGGMLMRGVFGHHDRAKFEIHGYALNRDDGSSFRTDAMHDIEYFHDISMLGTADAAAAIHADGIHILLDMKGWTENNRQDILACRPAPIQISWLGYAAPMVAPWIDYQIVDPVLLSAAERDAYDVSTIALPDCYQPNDDRRPLPTGSAKRSDFGLPDDTVILGCFNSPYKMTRAQFDVWLDILRQRSEAVLWLLMIDPAMGQALHNYARSRGIDPARIILAPPMPLAQHVDRLSLVDIGLDTFPYGGHTTTSEALWAGVPVISKKGQGFASRVAASLLQACQLPELVVNNDERYINHVLTLIDRPGHRAALRNHLISNRLQLPLFNTAHKAYQIEQLAEIVWHRHQQGLPPSHITLVAESENNQS